MQTPAWSLHQRWCLCRWWWRCIPWASYQIRKIAGCACAGNAGNIFPRRRFQSKSLVSDPGMHHGTCVTHVPWCMSGSLIRRDGENVPGIPGACAPAILRIWQEAHGMCLCWWLLWCWLSGVGRSGCQRLYWCWWINTFIPMPKTAHKYTVSSNPTPRSGLWNGNVFIP